MMPAAAEARNLDLRLVRRRKSEGSCLDITSTVTAGLQSQKERFIGPVVPLAEHISLVAQARHGFRIHPSFQSDAPRDGEGTGPAAVNRVADSVEPQCSPDFA